MSDRVCELFTYATFDRDVDWHQVVTQSQHCVHLKKRCDKRRKSHPDVAIGTCSLAHGAKDSRNLIICPWRFLERNQIFLDSIHRLGLHEPGNELHIVAEQSIPGGSVDYFLVSARRRKVVDFVGIEIQALDTTGTAWPERQKFLASVGFEPDDYGDPDRSYGMNWKMTAKTILVQLHHKVETFEHLGKHLVLVLQDHLLAYMRSAFNFDHIRDARQGDSMHFHAYELLQTRERSAEDDGRRSMAAVSRHTPHGARVGYVYTPPIWRGRGYASACTAELSRQIIASGKRFCFLYTDLSNPTSNAIYQRIGYRPVCDVLDCRFEATAD